MSGAVYQESMIDGQIYCRSNGQFTKHLRKYGLSYRQYYEKYVTGIEKLCYCGQPATFYQKNHSYAESCGDPGCVGKSVAKTKQTWSEEKKKTDSENKKTAARARTKKQIQAQVEKTRQTFLVRYGTSWGTQSPEFKEKSKKTKLARYGNEYYNGNIKTSMAWQAKTTEEIGKIAAKRRATCLVRHGVENVLMLPTAKKNSARANSFGKELLLPSGRIIGVRGHEDVVILKLLETYSEEELMVDDRKTSYTLPVFNYIDHRRHRLNYYPDIFIKKENKIIEVKSQWWWDGNGAEKYTCRLINNLKKRDAVLAAGFIYEVWLFKTALEYEVLIWQ